MNDDLPNRDPTRKQPAPRTPAKPPPKDRPIKPQGAAAPKGNLPEPPVPPRIRPAVPSHRPVRDAVPSATPAEPDDDAVIVPAPTIDAFLIGQRKAAAKANEPNGMMLMVGPILLMMGVLFTALGGLWFMTEPESVFRLLGRWVPISLLTAGPIFLLVGATNLFFTRNVRSEK